MGVLLNCFLPFSDENPASSPRQIPLGTGRCCNAREKEILCCFRVGGEVCAECFASNSSPLGFAAEGRIVQTL